MATSFDATARISLDIRAFAQGANAVTKTGGQMEKVFQNLNTVMGKVAHVNQDLAAKIRTSASAYNAALSVVKNFSQVSAQLAKSEQSQANVTKTLVNTFGQLRSALASVQGLSEKEYQRINRTVTVYERLAKVVLTLASAQKNMSSVTQNAISAEQKEEAAKRKAAETSQRLQLEEQKLAIQREKLAQSAQRIAQQEQTLAAARARSAQATQNAATSTTSFSGSTFALRNTIGELEQSFQSLFNTLVKIPTAFASAAISQESAFAQVERVVGSADAASVGLLQRFQQIAQTSPISFEEVSKIGQLGAQIGISAESLGDFTNTIVKFSLTTGVAAEEATLLLGRIAQMEDVPISEIEQLGSAILALGTASAATDQEILRVNASIATVANLFGLTAQETAGLSAALATLQVRPELARGALTRVFNDLGTSVSNGGTALTKLSKVMGMTNGEVTKLFNNPATRGDFLLAFIKGLSNAAGAGGDVQGVLRELGVNAVRDIDVFSRLANNFNIVSDSLDKANVEFARGSELNRQSAGIYNTTAAQIQNLGDAFQTLLANLGGPLANAIGTIASGLDTVIKWISKLGPIVPIFGTLAAVIISGGAAWAIYQVALAKTIQSLIAVKELQDRLSVSSLTAKKALDIYRNGFAGTAEAQAIAANSTRSLAVNTEALSTALAASSRTLQGYGAAAASSTAGLDSLSLASANAARGQDALFASSLATQNSLRQVSTQATTSALAMANVSRSNQALALTQTQLAGSSKLFAGQTAIAAGAAQGLNTTTARSVPTLNLMSGSMRQAASAGAQMGAGMDTAAVSSATASGAFTRAATGMTLASSAAKVGTLALSSWGIGILTVGILLAPLIGKMLDFRTASDKLADSALAASGGTTALSNAIKADTEAAVTAAGGQDKYNKAVADGSDAALGAIGVYRTVTTEKNNLTDAQQRSAESARTEAQQQIKAIEMTKGSVAELKEQAQGHGIGAEAAQRYLTEIEKANTTVRESTKVLGQNTAAIGDNVKQWLLDTAQAAVEQSKLADGSKISRDALQQLGETGLNVGDLLQESLSNPDAALKQLDSAIGTVGKTADNFDPGGGLSDYGKQIDSSAAAATRLKNFLEALRVVISSEGSAATKSALAKSLLADALDTTGESASSASGKIKLTKEALEDLDTDADTAKQAMDSLAQTFEKFGTPMDAFTAAAKSAFGDASDAVEKFSLKSKTGLNDYIKELEKIAKAQRDWSANLIKISTTLGPEIAAQFQKLGPDAAPAVAELANLSAKELQKLGPRLAEIGGDATSDLAAAIVQNSGKVKNATLQTKTVIASVFGNLIDKAKTSADFAEVSNQYAALITQLGKLKGVKIDISADDAKAFKSLSDLSTYIDLVGSKKIAPEIAISIVKAQGDIQRLQQIIAAAEAGGLLDPKGIAALDSVLFKAQLAQLTTDVGALEAEGKLDAQGKGKLDDKEYRDKVLSLTQFLASSQGQGLLNPQGKAQLDDKEYRAQMEALAQLILGKEAAGEFDANGDGKLSTDEFTHLLDALKGAVADANKGKLSPKGTVTLAGVSTFNRQLGGIVNAAYSAGGRITQALTRQATVSVGYYYYQKNSPPKTAQAANGGWINGPGGPKSDVIPAMLSNGEFVVNAAAAQRFGALLEIINRHGGRGFSGVAQRLLDTAVTGGSRQVKVRQGGSSNAMLGGSGAVNQMPPEGAASFTARLIAPNQGPTNVFNINNQYPQAEPTSTTINRSLAYAATISGV